MKAIALIAMLVALAATSGAQARSIDDCEKINNPMLYNQCLAEFSPAAKRTGPSRSSSVEPAYDPPPRNSSSYQRQRLPADDLGSTVVQRSKSGRKVATFDIITPEKPRRRRR